jgi:hypothetical protein
LLDAVLRAADAFGVAVVLRLPPPAGAEAEHLHATLGVFIQRFAAMPALAAWEVAASGEVAEAARRFLNAYDPRRPVLMAG